MKDKVKKGIELCSNWKQGNCDKCPYTSIEDNCEYALFKDMIAVMNEQEQYISDLERDIKAFQSKGLTASAVQEILTENERLKHKIENGTLIELPCKINDIVYQVCEKPIGSLFVNVKKEYFIVEHRIGNIKMSMLGAKPIFCIATINEELGVYIWSGEHINTHLFLTKAEAEAKLKELKGE